MSKTRLNLERSMTILQGLEKMVALYPVTQEEESKRFSENHS